MYGTSNATTISVLNDLIDICKDGEYGFRSCAQQAESAELRQHLQQRSQACVEAVAQLQNQVFALGGMPDDGGTVGGAMHRGWVSIRTTLARLDDVALMEQAERGDDAAIERYRDALRQPLPAPIRALLQQQYDAVRHEQQQVREQRGALQE